MHQFANPLMMYPSVNITYWIFLLLKIPQFFTSNYWFSVLADCILISSCIGIILYPKKYVLAIVFTLSYWLNYMGYCMVFVYQPSVYAPLILCIPSMFKTDFKFSLTFWAIRFWACFLYFEAGFLKIYRGGVFYAEHMVNSIKISIPLYFVQEPEAGFRLSIKEFFLANPTLAQTLFIIATLLELTFIIGFFTRKFDWYLLILFLSFHIFNEQLMNMTFMNHLILYSCCFIPWDKIDLSRFGMVLIKQDKN